MPFIKYSSLTILVLIFTFSCKPKSKEANSNSVKEKQENNSDQKCSCTKVFSDQLLLDTLEKYIKSTVEINKNVKPPSLYNIDFDRESSDTFITFSSFYFMPEIVPHMNDTFKIIGYCQYLNNDIVIIDKFPFFGTGFYNKNLLCDYKEIEKKYLWNVTNNFEYLEEYKRYVNPMWKFQIINKKTKLIKVTNRVALE